MKITFDNMCMTGCKIVKENKIKKSNIDMIKNFISMSNDLTDEDLQELIKFIENIKSDKNI